MQNSKSLTLLTLIIKLKTTTYLGVHLGYTPCKYYSIYIPIYCKYKL